MKGFILALVLAVSVSALSQQPTTQQQPTNSDAVTSLQLKAYLKNLKHSAKNAKLQAKLMREQNKYEKYVADSEAKIKKQKDKEAAKK